MTLTEKLKEIEERVAKCEVAVILPPTDIKLLLEIIKIQGEALNYYANYQTWKDNGAEKFCVIPDEDLCGNDFQEGGKKARQALAEIEGKIDGK